MGTKTISEKFQKRLALIVVISLLASSTFLFLMNTSINNKNYESIIRSTLEDVEKDIGATSDYYILDLAKTVLSKAEIILRDRKIGQEDEVNGSLKQIADNYNLSELNIIDSGDIIVYSSKADYVGFDMNSNKNSKEFGILNEGASQLVQPVRANAISNDDTVVYNKYAGIPLTNGGYIQIAITSSRFQQQIDSQINYIAENRHIGNLGYVIVANSDGLIISDASSTEAEGNVSLSDMGIEFDKENGLGKSFKCMINDDEYMCIPVFVEGYYIIGVVPVSEVQSFRNRAAISDTLTEVIIFVLMFFFINRMIKSIIVDKIHGINDSLTEIIDGKLDTKVEEYSTVEFTKLSNDINSTVSSLKQYTDSEKEKIKKELEFAKNIQMSALPKLSSLSPYRSGFELYATINTAKEVGGDFYDFYMLDDSRLAVLIADVSGKGVPAAMFMMTVKTMIKNNVESGCALNEAFNKVNDELCESNDAGMFVTVWMGILDLNTGHIEYINAGHNPPLFYDENGNFEFLQCKPGFILTGVPGYKYKLHETTLMHGGKFFLYTDGVTEAINPREEMYGEERLKNYLNREKDNNLSNILLGLKNDIDSFAEEAEQFDDITMVSVLYE